MPSKESYGDAGRRRIHNDKQQPRLCFRCHQPGHLAKDCPNSRQDVADQAMMEKTQQHQRHTNGTTRFTGRQRHEAGAGPGVCFRCQQPGHLARNCPRNSDKNRGESYGLVPCILDPSRESVLLVFQMSYSAMLGDLKIDPLRGHQEEDEIPLQTAIREAWEESHFVIDLRKMTITSSMDSSKAGSNMTSPKVTTAGGEGQVDELQSDDAGTLKNSTLPAEDADASKTTTTTEGNTLSSTLSRPSHQWALPNNRRNPSVFFVPIAMDTLLPQCTDMVVLEEYLNELFSHNTDVIANDKDAYPGTFETSSLRVIRVWLNTETNHKDIETVDMLKDRKPTRLASQTKALMREVPIAALLQTQPIAMILQDNAQNIRSLVPC